MLIFLLNSYNSSNVVVTVPEGVKLPTSTSKKENSTGVMVQVSPVKIWVDDKEVLDTTVKESNIYDDGNRRIIPLYNELVKKRQDVELIAKTVKNANKFSGVVNLVVDKSIKYSYVKKLLYTSALAGYKQYKFVVIGEE